VVHARALSTGEELRVTQSAAGITIQLPPLSATAEPSPDRVIVLETRR
jgi:hypothetical protein